MAGENSAPTRTFSNGQFQDYPYPDGTKPYINHTDIANYVHSYAKHFGVDEVTSYDTRVELVEKVAQYWRIRLRRLDEVDGQLKETMWDEVSGGGGRARGNAAKVVGAGEHERVRARA